MEALERHFISSDWITALLFFGLLCLVFSKAFFFSRFINFIILPFNNKYLFLYNKKGLLVNGFHLILSLFTLVIMALYCSLAFEVIFKDTIWDTGSTYLFFLLGILAVLALKIILQLIGGFIFNTDKLMASLIFVKMTYLNYSALLMFTASVLLTYVLPDSQVIVFISLFLIILINAIGLATLLKIHQKFIAIHFFYFILYLCTLEIAPFLLVVNLLKD